MFKKKKLILTANTYSTGLIEFFPVVKGASVYPSWFKRLPKGVPNVRVCAGMTDLYSNSLVMPCWQDYEITIFPNGDVQADVPNTSVGIARHDIENQATGAWPRHVNVKLISPWIFTCNEDVLWTMVQPVWSQTSPTDYTLITGMLEFKYQNQTNVNLLFPIPVGTEKTYTIKAGDPVAMFVPMTERNVDLELKYVDDRDIKKIMNNRWIFTKGPVYSRLRSMSRKNK